MEQGEYCGILISMQDFLWDICKMDADGTDIEQLTERYGWEDYHTWSPDGTKIAFSAY